MVDNDGESRRDDVVDGTTPIETRPVAEHCSQPSTAGHHCSKIYILCRFCFAQRWATLDAEITLLLNPSVAMVFLKRRLQLGGGVNDPPGVSRILCHLELKFQRLYPCFQG